MTIITTVKGIMVGTGDSGNLYKSMQGQTEEERLIRHEDSRRFNSCNSHWSYEEVAPFLCLNMKKSLYFKLKL